MGVCAELRRSAPCRHQDGIEAAKNHQTEHEDATEKGRGIFAAGPDEVDNCRGEEGRWVR